MFKIGDFSKLTQISVRMLRYYENKGLLLPTMIDEESKYRWYSVSQIKDVNKIKVLRDIGFLVDEIKQVLLLNEEEFIKAIKEQKEKIKEEIVKQQGIINKLDILEKTLNKEHILEWEYEVNIKEIPELNIISYRQIMNDYYDEGNIWRILGNYIKDNKIVTSDAHSIAIYHTSEDIDVEVCFVVPKIEKDNPPFCYRVLPAVKKMAYIFVYGSFDNIGPKYQEFAYWLDMNKYEIIGNVRQIAINGPWNRDQEDEYLTEIQIPIK
ncbi:MAG: MerR family transcriptional regulator [Coprobacillaceae bacterium]